MNSVPFVSKIIETDMLKVINKILNSWFIFSATVAPTNNGISRSNNAVLLMSMWISMAVIAFLFFINNHGAPIINFYVSLWPRSDNFRSIYNPSVHIFLFIFILSVTLTFNVSKKYKKTINQIVTPNNLENVGLLIYALCIMLSLFALIEFTFYILLLLHFLTILYFYFTKSTFGLKLDEQATLDKNKKGPE